MYEIKVNDESAPMYLQIHDFVCMLFQIDEDLTAKINMADYKFSFHEKGKLFSPAWCSPEGMCFISLWILYHLLSHSQAPAGINLHHCCAISVPPNRS